MEITKIVKLLLKTLLFSLLLLGGLVVLIFSLTPSIERSNRLSTVQLAKSQGLVEQIQQILLSNNKSASISLNGDDLNLISQYLSHTVNKLDLQINILAQEVYLAASYQFHLNGKKIFVNGQCLLTQDEKHLMIDGCFVGQLPVPDLLIDSFLLYNWSVQGNTTSVKNAKQILTYLSVNESELAIAINDVRTLKKNIKTFAQQALGQQVAHVNVSGVEKDKVRFYINIIESSEIESRSLAPYLFDLFAQVEQYKDHNELAEHRAALWAMVIVFGHHQFSQLLGFEYKPKKHLSRKRLAKRRDLALHFLYSILLTLNGEENIAQKIGELKEIIDTNKGGSGFSFADLAADFAGVQFARQLTDINRFHDVSQRLIYVANNFDATNESYFFPDIKDLPEGIRQGDFVEIYESGNNENYQLMLNSIHQRIDTLYIYR